MSRKLLAIKSTGLICLLLVTAGPLCTKAYSSGAQHSSGNINRSMIDAQPNRPPGESAKTPKYSRGVVKMVINAPPEKVWTSLGDFQHYPKIFKRMRSCSVVKQQGDLIWLESNLKPQFFVRRTFNRTLIDLAGKPMVLNFRTLDEKYDAVRGTWELRPGNDQNHCQVTYIVEMAPGGMVPDCLISLALKLVQKEIVVQLKDWVENTSDSRTGAIPKLGNQDT